MLLQVDVYPFDGTAVSSQPTTYYVHPSTATTSNNNNSTLIVVGRKSGNVLLPDDKSVSREHCLLHLRTQESTIQNEDERHYGNQSVDKSCLVLESTGKLGCFLVRRTPKPKLGSDDDATDEEPEGSLLPAASQSQLVTTVLSTIAKSLLGPTDTVTVDFVGPNQSVVLNELCWTTLDSFPTRPLMIQCGKSGSTLVLRRMDIRVTWGSNRPAGLEQDVLQAAGAYAGVEDRSVATHFCTPTYCPSAFQLAAWYRDLVFCSPAYIQAIAQRTTLTDPMPQPQNFVPKSDGYDFWQTKANSKLWKGWTYLSLTEDDEYQDMVVAAGGTSLPLHNVDNAEQVAKDAFAENPRMFMLTGLRTKLFKTLSTLGIPKYTRKALAGCLSKQQLPDGSDPPTVPETTPASEDAAAPAPAEEPVVAKLAAQQAAEMFVDDHDSKANQEGAGTKPAASTTKSKRSSLGRGRNRELDVRNNEPRPQSPIDQEDDPVIPGAQDDEPMPPVADDKAELAASVGAPVRKRSRAIEEDKNQEIDRPMKRKALEPLSDGWMSALPNGKQRKEFVRSKEAISDMTGDDDVVDAASTEECSGLVVPRSAPPTRNPARQRAVGGLDFRAFRKNAVPINIAKVISLRSVAATVLEKDQSQYDELRHEMAEHQRQADALFQDPVGAAGSRRRRVA